jgi:hypothetical protein
MYISWRLERLIGRMLQLSAPGTLELTITKDTLANWIIVSNLLYEKKAGAPPPRWNGVLFSLIDKYEIFPTGNKDNGLNRVVLSNRRRDVLKEISASQFRDGDFLYVVVGEDPSGKEPSANPGEDASQLWHGSLHTHCDPLPGGIILWKYRDNEIRIRLSDESNPNYKKYEFECDVDDAPIVRLYKSDGTLIEDFTQKYVGYIDLLGWGDPDAADLMNPPRYP